MAQPDFILSLDGVPHDDLRVLAFEGHEAVSEPYRFTLELVSGDPDLALETLLQRPAFLRLTTQGERGIHGLVGRIEQIDCTTQLSRYRLVLGPQLLRLKLRRNCRVFQERSVPQILATLLEEHGIQADTCRFRLGADYPARAYCTQYGETDLEFLHRLCAEEGLHYHFEHHADRHELVFGDNQTVFPRLQQPAPFDLNPGLNLYLPPDCARRVVHLTARDEKRWSFALNSLAPDHQEIELPGCHSDIGGGYPPLMTEKLLIGKPRPVLLYWGRSPEQSAAWRDAVAEAEQLELQGVPAGSLHIVTRPLSPSRQRSTASSERHLVLLEVERQVRGELARVYLWAMHRLASAAEVPLPSLDTTDPRLAIPADLKPIAEKLLAAVQDGVPPALSFEEERYLRARYIHLSAHWTPLQGLLVNKPAPNGRLVYRNQPQKDYPA